MKKNNQLETANSPFQIPSFVSDKIPKPVLNDQILWEDFCPLELLTLCFGMQSCWIIAQCTTEHVQHQEIPLFMEKIALRRGGEPLLEKRPEDEISIVSSRAICK